MSLKQAACVVPLLLATMAHAQGAPAATFTPALAPVEQQDAVDAPHSCVTQTGSLIHHADDCVNVNGRAYYLHDMENTGAVTPADALYKLDPSVTIRR